MSDRDPTIINTGSNGSGGWALAVILLVAVIGLGLYLFGGGLFGDQEVDVDVSLPRAEAPADPSD
ncbi:hypothetical protein REJC140_02652 [Pseudorhizobium endolithicum]|uniref:Uncharacterized protein n=1 Tax=Pseudorhizobium endolithicum TaxID=1191678 RepID=A0ABN7JGR1_9HYPH|nr:hypothetical protein [Pseudorhizobium endolithicum]CAD6422286.1 hypothetical protein REQ54_02344 [Rhizobium sp. Q54]CAD7028615.1 hypothetical protein REJC140_02652 [Pseudorhizobium endolithicum]